MGTHPVRGPFGEGTPVEPVDPVRGDGPIGGCEVGLAEHLAGDEGSPIALQEDRAGLLGSWEPAMGVKEAAGIVAIDGESVLGDPCGGLEQGAQGQPAKALAGLGQHREFTGDADGEGPILLGRRRRGWTPARPQPTQEIQLAHVRSHLGRAGSGQRRIRRRGGHESDVPVQCVPAPRVTPEYVRLIEPRTHSARPKDAEMDVAR